MRTQNIFFVLVFLWIVVLSLWAIAPNPAEALSTNDVAPAKIEPKASYPVTDPETGRTVLLPASKLPAGYQPPPSTGPCDKEVEKLVDDWRGSIKFAVGALAFVTVVFGLFALLDSSSDDY
jgi:hypothetical protein